jgi:hypothetical protein
LSEVMIPAADVASPPQGWQWWLLRALAGLAFGFGCNGALQACWIALLVVVHGSLDSALNEVRPSPTVHAAAAAYFASSPASFLGALIAPLVLGASTQRRRAVVASSIAGAALATFAAVAFGAFAGWLSWQVAPQSMMFVWIALGFGVLAGTGGGWLGGRRAMSNRFTV